MNAPQPEEDPFVAEVRRQAERAERARHITFWQGMGLVGSVGWMVAVPTVGGALLGRWLDRHFASGVFWTLSLLLAGVTLGCISTWRQIKRDIKP
jgi:ATP synthase protein I